MRIMRNRRLAGSVFVLGTLLVELGPRYEAMPLSLSLNDRVLHTLGYIERAALPVLMLVDDADRQARWYFELKAAYLASRRTGEPMRHPFSGPVTLHWRS